MTASGRRPLLATDLPPVEQLVLWGLRVFAAGQRRQVAVADFVRGVFAQAMAEAAAGPLQALVIFLAEGAKGEIRTACPRQPVLLPDEARILDLMADYQAGRDIAAFFKLGSLLTPEAARLSGPVFRMATRALADAGLYLACPCQGAEPVTGTVAGQRPPVRDFPPSPTLH